MKYFNLAFVVLERRENTVTIKKIKKNIYIVKSGDLVMPMLVPASQSLTIGEKYKSTDTILTFYNTGRNAKLVLSATTFKPLQIINFKGKCNSSRGYFCERDSCKT